MKQRRGVPQSTPKAMADQLTSEFIRPFAIAKQNLSIAKTQYQIAYWREVILALTVSPK